MSARQLLSMLGALGLALLAPSALAGCTEQLEQSMTATLATAPTDTDFTLMLERADGRAYRYSRGASTSTTSYESASTSKLVSAVVISAGTRNTHNR